MAIKPQLVCWDSCVIINYLEQHPTRYPEILPIADRAERGELLIVVSEISVAEVIKLDSLTGQGVTSSDQQSIIEDFFERAYIVPRVVDRPVSNLAAQLQRNYSVKTCDAVILATAIFHSAEVVYTYDGHKDDSLPKKMLALDGVIPTRIVGKNLAVKPPTEFGQLGLL